MPTQEELDTAWAELDNGHGWAGVWFRTWAQPKTKMAAVCLPKFK
jgi:hypothetical protein